MVGYFCFGFALNRKKRRAARLTNKKRSHEGKFRAGSERLCALEAQLGTRESRGDGVGGGRGALYLWALLTHCIYCIISNNSANFSNRWLF